MITPHYLELFVMVAAQYAALNFKTDSIHKTDDFDHGALFLLRWNTLHDLIS